MKKKTKKKNIRDLLLEDPEKLYRILDRLLSRSPKPNSNAVKKRKRRAKKTSRKLSL